jgi:hypothetical protein
MDLPSNRHRVRRTTVKFPILRIALMLTVLCFVPALMAQTTGQWLVEKHDDGAQLSFQYTNSTVGDHYSSNWSNSDDPAKLGIADVLKQQGHVAFDIVRPAGTFHCEGWMNAGKGSGHFTFSPNAQFSAELAKRGLGTPEERQSLRMAISNVGLSLVDALKSNGYTFNLDAFVRAATHGVNEQYLSEMKAAGLKPESLEELVRMRDHGVTADYVRELQAAGYKGLSYSEMVRMRDHGVNASYVRELASVGVKNLSAQEIVRMRDHGVTADYAKQLASVGLKGLDGDSMARMRDHGVSAEFAAEIKRDAYPDITSEQLVRLRDHGVSAEFVKENAKGNSVEEVIRMHDTGARKHDMI